jgi:hypothetical protein
VANTRGRALRNTGIVDPQTERITVLRLAGKRYLVHGDFGRGEIADSHLLAGFSVDVTTAFERQSAVAGKSKAGSKGQRRRRRS